MADIDGTLIGRARHASTAVIAAIGRAQRAGLHVGFATARMRAGIDVVAPGVRVPGPHIVHNGAEVVYEGASLRTWPLGPTVVAQILSVCDRRRWYAAFYTSEACLVTDHRPEADRHWRLMGRAPDGTTADLDAAQSARVLKARVFVFGASPDVVVATVAATGANCVVATSPQEPATNFVNVTSASASKGVALEVASAHLGLSLDRVVAVGDGENDLPLFAASGTAIAMGQAPSAVRAAAHWVAPDVDADGAADALHAAVEWKTSTRPPGGT